MDIKLPHAGKSDSADWKAEAIIGGATAARNAAPADPSPARTTVNMRFDVALLRRIDEAARNQGISRTAWLHVAASKALE